MQLLRGVRFMSAYPITPASEIMEYMIKKLPKLGGAVIQTEDEIAAAKMAIGANYGWCSFIHSICRSWSIINDGSNWFIWYDRKTTCYY